MDLIFQLWQTVVLWYVNTFDGIKRNIDTVLTCTYPTDPLAGPNK